VIFDAIERIGQIATNKRLTGVMLDYNLEVLSAVLAQRIEQSAFRTKRWLRSGRPWRSKSGTEKNQPVVGTD
jgi:hypothetical protein